MRTRHSTTGKTRWPKEKQERDTEKGGGNFVSNLERDLRKLNLRTYKISQNWSQKLKENLRINLINKHGYTVLSEFMVTP